MKRTFYLFIVLLLVSCVNTGLSPITVFEEFVDGVANSNLKAINKVSTETTFKIVEQMLDGQRMQRKPQIFSTIIHNVSSASGIYPNIVIIKDSISDDATKAWVWFMTDSSDSQMVVQLVRSDGRWLVDIPLLN